MALGTTVAFTECREEHVEDVREFFARVYRPDYVLAIDERLFRWQFGGLNGGSARCYHLTLALVGGTIAGCLGYIPVEATMRGRVLRGAWTANWIVAPEHRHLALGPRLMRALVRRHDVVLVAGASPQALEILPRLGFVHFGSLGRHVRVLDRAGLEQLTGRPSPQSLTREPSPGPPDPSLVVGRVARFDASIDGLWESVWGEGAGTRRSAAYLNWRYADHPTFEYRLFRASSNGVSSGLGVYRVENVRGTPLRVGRVVELLALEGSEGGLVGAIEDDARREHLVLLDLFCSSQKMAPALNGRGWFTDDGETANIPVLFQPVVPGRRKIPFLACLGRATPLLSRDDWYVTKGDGDQDRPN